MEKPLISVIIPNYNGKSTIGLCLDSVYEAWGSRAGLEVIAVDDCSSDGSADIIKRYPCRLIMLETRSGASRARNEGARAASSDILFFIDSDCLVSAATFKEVEASLGLLPSSIVGGTYTPVPHDKDFFSRFQSVFINYSETKSKSPDYIATHAMLIDGKLFYESGGFKEDFLPIIEDVEFSHRLRRAGANLVMKPALEVTHIFGFSFIKSLRNAFRKSHFWTIYSLSNRDILSDSGTASRELKANVMSAFALIMLSIPLALLGEPALPAVMASIASANLFINRNFAKALYNAGGWLFALKGLLYYATLYALVIGFGGGMGALKYYLTALLRPTSKG